MAEIATAPLAPAKPTTPNAPAPTASDTPMSRARQRIQDSAVLADLDAPDPLRTSKPVKASPKPAEPPKPKVADEPPKPKEPDTLDPEEPKPEPS